MKDFSMHSFVAGFMLGALAVGAWWFSGDNSPLQLSHEEVSSKKVGRAAAPQSGAVSVADQPAGLEAFVASVDVPPPGVWVAVREMSGDNLGNVLGAARVDSPRESVVVSLLRATVPGFPYAVEFYRDDGDGVFDLATDSVYIDFATGAPVIAHFVTTE